MRAPPLLPALVVAAWCAAAAAAQQAPPEPPARSTVVGLVLSRQTEQPVAGARVAIRRWMPGTPIPPAAEHAATSDAKGQFRFEKLRPGRYIIEAAWQNDSLPGTIIELADREKLEVELTVGPFLTDLAGRAVTLPEIRTEGRKARGLGERDAFEERRRTGIGQYITAEMIEKRNAPAFFDLLRMASGVEVRCGGRDRDCLPRMTRAPGACLPQAYLDGSESDIRSLAHLRPTDVEAIEIYNGLATIPIELLDDPRLAKCGVIVVWTRRGRS